ncbi:hypothetical protein Psch_03804 [Pelotomaculum schinkii]|uniref:Uncharacterized protein n=1 Tax=Pelotomaculum schinkii TaxID=78350 RepID=A0A4Y7R8R8_9FIRM|nr:hypothetical protein [Pelotomaculum schinkii]TEB05041.1 hypothetical protein Psch_03804 [Pelotomaculum schinkii]
MKEESEKKVTKINKQWCMRIKLFYRHLEDWLSDLIEEKLLFTLYEDMTIYKQSLGAYYAKKFILIAGDKRIEFIPNIRSAVGTTGNIQLKTKKGKITFVSDRDGIWKQVISLSPFEAKILTKDYLRNLLKSLLI